MEVTYTPTILSKFHQELTGKRKNVLTPMFHEAFKAWIRGIANDEDSFSGKQLPQGNYVTDFQQVVATPELGKGFNPPFNYHLRISPEEEELGFNLGTFYRRRVIGSGVKVLTSETDIASTNDRVSWNFINNVMIKGKEAPVLDLVSDFEEFTEKMSLEDLMGATQANLSKGKTECLTSDIREFYDL